MKFSQLKTKLVNGNWNTVDEFEIREYVPVGEKFGIVQQIADNIIKVDKGYAVIDRLQREINLYYLLISLYTNIEFEEVDFTDKDCDFLAMNKFKDYLRKITKNDSHDFERLFSDVLIDEVRRLNSGMSFDIDGTKDVLDQFKNLDPKTLEILENLNPDKINIAREMVQNESSNNNGDNTSTT